MIAIEVEFLHGTYRGASAEDLALAGDAASSPEWPPSPARLYSALVAGGGTGEGTRRGADGVTGLNLLEGKAPTIFAASSADREQVSLRRRYAIVDDSTEGSVQNYPARTAQEVRPGARIVLARPTVRFEWPDVTPTREELGALRFRAARIGYLGCSDSPVRVTVMTEPATPNVPAWRPDPSGNVMLPVPYEGYLDRLDAAFEAWSGGQPVRRAWIRNRVEGYADPDASREVLGPGYHAVWLRFDRPIRYRLVRVVAETLRAAVLEHIDHAAGSSDTVPPVVHGHGELDDHAYWVPLPWVGGVHADGRIMGAGILLPSAVGEETLGQVREAVARLKVLARPGVFRTDVWLFDGSQRPWSTHPARWRGPSRRWVSAFPVVQERFTDGPPNPDDLTAWCRFAGLPEGVSVVEVRSVSVPILTGSQGLAARDVRRRPDDRRPFGHIEITFDAEVIGPLVIGSMRHFGLGLMAPLDGSPQ